jgi:hypothetical protein
MSFAMPSDEFGQPRERRLWPCCEEWQAMRAAGHLSVKFGRVIGALTSDINGLRGSVLCVDRYTSSRPGKSQDWKAKAGASSPAHWHEMIRDLSFGNPLIVGLTNDDDSLHAVVVTAIAYRRGWDGAPAYESVVIRDRWSESGSCESS